MRMTYSTRITKNDLCLNFLCDVYTNWLDDQKIDHKICASELLYGRIRSQLTNSQKQWLGTFIEIWEVTSENT